MKMKIIFGYYERSVCLFLRLSTTASLCNYNYFSCVFRCSCDALKVVTVEEHFL